MDSIPSVNEAAWISTTNDNSTTKQEFHFDRPFDKMDFKLQINCSNSCWRSMVPNDDEIVLAVRCFKDNKLVNQVE